MYGIIYPPSKPAILPVVRGMTLYDTWAGAPWATTYGQGALPPGWSDPNYPTDPKGLWQVVNGVVVLNHPGATPAPFLRRTDFTCEDMYVEAEMVVQASDEIGISARSTPDNSGGYSVHFYGSSGAYTAFAGNGTSTYSLGAKTGPWQPGVPFIAGLAVHGNTIEVYINGTLVGSYTDTGWTQPGTVGLCLWNATTGSSWNWIRAQQI